MLICFNLTQDGGLIDFLTIKDNDASNIQIERTEQIEDHGYSVIAVKLACSGKTAITASMDMRYVASCLI